MARNVFTSDDLAEGTKWTFVHSNGKRSYFTYTSLMAPRNAAANNGLGHDALHRLTNIDTGGDAMVSEKWLREGPLGLQSSPTGFGSHWLVGHVEDAAVAA